MRERGRGSGWAEIARCILCRMATHMLALGRLPCLSSFPGLPEMFRQNAKMSRPNGNIFEQRAKSSGSRREGQSCALRGAIAYRLAGRLCTMTVVAVETGVRGRSLE